MIKPLEFLAIKLCEKIPLRLGLYRIPITLFEKDGVCQKPSNNCKYCIKKYKDNYLCHKKTYDFNPKFILTF